MCPSRQAADRQNTVVLVHGLASMPFVMAPLAKSLSGHYENVVNWTYPSLWSRIERHAAALARLLKRLDDEDSDSEVHLITHSMGGIIGRLATRRILAATDGPLCHDRAFRTGGSPIARRFTRRGWDDSVRHCIN